MTRFACGQRTTIEAAVSRGLIERLAGERLLKKYGTVMTPVTRVNQIEAGPVPALQTELFKSTWNE